MGLLVLMTQCPQSWSCVVRWWLSHRHGDVAPAMGEWPLVLVFCGVCPTIKSPSASVHWTPSVMWERAVQ